MTADKAL